MCLLDHILTISDSEKKKAVEKKRVLDILIVGLDAATFSALILQPIFFLLRMYLLAHLSSSQLFLAANVSLLAHLSSSQLFFAANVSRLA